MCVPLRCMSCYFKGAPKGTRRLRVTFVCSFDSYRSVASAAAAPTMLLLCWCETKRIAFVKVYSLQFSLISPGTRVLNYMLQRTPHSYFYKSQVIRQTGSAHVPRYDSFRSQGFRPLFPSKYRLHSPSHPQWHTHTHTHTHMYNPYHPSPIPAPSN